MQSTQRAWRPARPGIPKAALRNSLGLALSVWHQPVKVWHRLYLALNLGSIQPKMRLCRLLKPRILEIWKLGIAGI